MGELSRIARIRGLIPDIVNGYPLESDEYPGWVSIIRPESGENLIVNPSFERGITGWYATPRFGFPPTSVLSRSIIQQYVGAFSMKITYSFIPSQETFGAISQEFDVEPGYAYTGSLYIYCEPGHHFQLYFSTMQSDARIVTSQITEFVSTGYWQRVSCVMHGGSPATQRSLTIVWTDYPFTGATFYIDGVQVERKPWLTTYMDGSLGEGYRWTGAEHSSTSVRSMVYSGGREMNLRDLGFYLIGIIGLGMMPINNVSVPMANGGAIYQRTVPMVRDFAIGGYIMSDGLNGLQRVRKELIRLVNPWRLGTDSPLMLKYHRFDEMGNETDTAYIPAVYKSGLEGSIDNENQERIGITFTQYLPFIKSAKSNAQELVVDFVRATDPFPPSPAAKAQRPSAFQHYDAILKRWISYGRYTDILLIPAAQMFNLNGQYYLAGNFTYPSIPVNYLASWTGEDADQPTTFGGLGSPNARVYDMDYDENGRVLVAGNFTAIGADTGLVRVARFTPAQSVIWGGADAWDDLGSAGLGIDAAVLRIVSDKMGHVYIGGEFTTINGQPVSKIACYTYATNTWSVMGSGVTAGNYVYAIATNGTGGVYAGGDFTEMNGIPDTKRISFWDGTNWTAMGTGINDGTVKDIAIAPNGYVYVVGNFDVVNGVAGYDGFAIWNGNTWLPAVSFATPPLFTPDITSVEVDPTTGVVYASGTLIFINNYYTSPGSVNAFMYKGGITYPIDAQVDKIYHIDGAGNIYAYYQETEQTLVTVESVSKVYPRIKIQGPAIFLGVVNHTTGQAIYSKKVVIQENETAYIVTQPGFVRFYSANRDLTNNLIGGGIVDFYLVNGENVIAQLVAIPDQAIINDQGNIFVGAGTDQPSSLRVEGANLTNTDDGKLYLNCLSDGVDWNITAYKDSLKLNDVMESFGTVADLPESMGFSIKNSSGMLASALINVFTADDIDIEIHLPKIQIEWEETYSSVDEMVR
jgi:hypothetical protein